MGVWEWEIRKVEGEMWEGGGERERKRYCIIHFSLGPDVWNHTIQRRP